MYRSGNLEVKRILIDTNAYAAFMHGDAEAEQIIEQASAVGIIVIVLGELLAGFKIGARLQENLDRLKRFLASPGVEIVVIEQSVAELYADVIAQLRAAGRPVPTNDVWIAATALARGYDLFSNDAHFRAVPGLKMVTRVGDLKSG